MNDLNRKYFDIAIVGCGPRGLFCLERLALEMAKLPTGNRKNVRITIFEPAACPGAGYVYDQGQPDCLLMNFAVRNIDIWSRESHIHYPATRKNLKRWLARHYPGLANSNGFVPRSIVGQYLHDGFQQVVESLPDEISLTIRNEMVIDVHESLRGWTVSTSQSIYHFNEVMLTVGHEGWRTASGKPTSLKVFPIEKELSTKKVQPNSTVGIKGFSLTFIDAVLGLTEMRGGKFSEDGSYLRCGREPSEIVPFSRTGRPMLAKPDMTRISFPDRWPRIFRHYGALMRHLESVADFEEEIMQLVFEAADEASGRDCRSWFESFISPPALDKMRTSYLCAVGETPLNEGMALAEAWRNLYPDIVRAIEHGKLEKAGWPSYRYYSTEMERIAFGPPAVNLGKVLSLQSEGIVKIDHPITEEDRFDTIIDARIPNPTMLAKNSPLAKLLKKGYLRQLHGEQGIEVNRVGRPISQEGETIAGLAIAGRATEGCVIGNDTLSRKLNTHIDQWAKDVAESNFFQTASQYEYAAV